MVEAKRVLYVMYGMPSCYNNGFAFAQRFLDDGIEITVVCDQDINALATAAGVPFRHLSALSYAQTIRGYLKITQSENRGRLKKLLYAIQIVRECRKYRQQTLENDELLQLISELNPDVLLIDIECHLAIIACSTLSIPTAICTRLFNHRPGKGVAPLHSSKLPSNQFVQKARITAQWWKLRVHSALISARQSVSRRRIMPVHYRSFSMPDIKAIARQYNVDLWSIATTAQWFRPVTYTHAPILSMTLRDIDFDRSNDKGFTYLGPMIGECDYAFSQQLDSADQLDHFIAHAKQKDRPIIYCAMGTYAQKNPQFADIIKNMALLRSDCAFIISFGGRESIDAYQQFPGNILLLETAPQIKCLANCDAAILHGGIASLQEALKYRVPVLCFSVGSNDQNGTVARWVNRQLATQFSFQNSTASSLSAELVRLLTDNELASRLEQYGSLVDKSVTDFSPKKVIRELYTQ